MKPIHDFLAEQYKLNGNSRWESTSPRFGVVGTYILGNQVDASTGQIGRELSAQEIDTITHSFNVMRQYVVNQRLHDICSRNYEEYEYELAAVSKSYSNNYNLEWENVNDMVTNINMRILNFLGAMRTYLDHTETGLKRTFGKDSHRYQAFKDATATAYDNFFSYRFVYKLRNFTQHCGMPLGLIQANSNFTLKGKKGPTHDMDFFFDRDYLLKNFDGWKAPVKEEIADMPEYFPIGPHLEFTMDSLQKIDDHLKRDEEKDIALPCRKIEEFLLECESYEGTPCIFRDLSIGYDHVKKAPIANINLERLHVHIVNQVRSNLKQRLKEFLSKSAHEKYAEGWERIFGSK